MSSVSASGVQNGPAAVAEGGTAEAPRTLSVSSYEADPRAASASPGTVRRTQSPPTWGSPRRLRHSTGLDEEQDLRARLERAERRLELVEQRLNDWRVAARQLLNVLALGPRSNEKYKRETVENLERILMKLEQVQQVHFINCSFPAIESQAPDFEMLSWDSLESSSWFVRWSPSWSVEVSLGGWHYIPFTLGIHVSKIKVNGRFKLSLAPDMSYAWVSFEKDVHVDMSVECEVTWGIVNVPLQAIIEGMVKKGFDDWLRSALIEPNRMRLSILADKMTGDALTEEDVAKAKSAAETARMRTPTTEESWTSGLVSMVSLGAPPAPSSPSANAAAAAYVASGGSGRPPAPPASPIEGVVRRTPTVPHPSPLVEANGTPQQVNDTGDEGNLEEARPTSGATASYL